MKEDGPDSKCLAPASSGGEIQQSVAQALPETQQAKSPHDNIANVPTVLRIGRFRFFFYSNEDNEPPHIDVKAAECEAKFWISPVRLAFNHGYKAHELTEIERMVSENQTLLLEAWHGYFIDR